MLPLCGPFRHEPMKNWASFIRINQNCNKNFERDWLSPARFEHLQDSVRVVLVIGHCRRTVKGTINTSCLWKWRERVMCAFVWHFAELTRCCFFYENVLMSSFFSEFCHSFDQLSSNSVCNHTRDGEIGLPLRGRLIC